MWQKYFQGLDLWGFAKVLTIRINRVELISDQLFLIVTIVWIDIVVSMLSHFIGSLQKYDIPCYYLYSQCYTMSRRLLEQLPWPETYAGEANGETLECNITCYMVY